MSRYDVISKTVFEKIDVDFGFSTFLTEAVDLLDTVVISPADDLVLSAVTLYPTGAEKIAKVVVSGGTKGKAYLLTAKAVTLAGRQLENSIVVVIE
jgi:hypothetical protein